MWILLGRLLRNRSCVGLLLMACLVRAMTAVSTAHPAAAQDALTPNAPLAVMAAITGQKSCDALGGIYQEALFLSITVLNTQPSPLATYVASHNLELVVAHSPEDLLAGRFERVETNGILTEPERPTKPVLLLPGRQVSFASSHWLTAAVSAGSAKGVLAGGTHYVQVRLGIRATNVSDSEPASWERSKRYFDAAPIFAVELAINPHPKGSCFGPK